LIQIENHNGSSYQLVVEARYDGGNNRLQAIAYPNSTTLTVTFTVDILKSGAVLVAGNGISNTFVLYGLFGLGEYSSEWRYYLGDGQFSTRQLVGTNGDILLARTYAPFGRILQQDGSGDSLYGFAGSQDGGMGLLYRDGRYYDPVTGRFLSPDHDFDPKRPSRTLNPYLAIFLANPIGLLMPPVLVLYWRRRKGKKGASSGLWFLVLVVVMVAFACDNTPLPPENTPPTATEVETPSTTATSTPEPPTQTATSTPTPTTTPTREPSATPIPSPCPTPTSTPETTATPREHWGTDRTVILGSALSEDDVFLLTLGVFAENKNASHPTWAMELWAWTFLNKLAYGLGSNMYTMLNSASTSGAWNDPSFVSGHEPFRGPVPSNPGEHREWLLEIARGNESVESDRGYMGGTSQNALNFQNLHGQTIQVYNAWRLYGTNSIQDPTHGAIFAVHRDPDRFQNELGPLFAAYAQTNPRFSYVFSVPYRFDPNSQADQSITMTVVGNEPCVYSHSLCN
jgi:RHS repeat-associated protein